MLKAPCAHTNTEMYLGLACAPPAIGILLRNSACPAWSHMSSVTIRDHR